MKKIILIIIGFLIPISVFAYTSPGKPTGFVNDFATILSIDEKQDIEAKLTSLRNLTSAEVSVVTINSLSNETIESYAVKLFQEWGIGNKDKDTGILILIAPNERQVRIEIGYGLEGAVTDLQSGNIIRNVMTPAFKEGKYGAGISGAVLALTEIITNSPEAEKYSIQNSSEKSSGVFSENIFGLFFFGIIIINFLARTLGKTKSWWLGGVIGAVIGAIVGLIWGFILTGLISILILSILGLIFDFFVSKNPPKSGGGGIWPIFFGGGRGGSSGFGGGGFGGFGGGMSGGGGASGRW